MLFFFFLPPLPVTSLRPSEHEDVNDWWDESLRVPSGDRWTRTVSHRCVRMCQLMHRWQTEQVRLSCSKSEPPAPLSHFYTGVYTRFIRIVERVFARKITALILLNLSVPRQATWCGSYPSNRHKFTSINSSKSSTAPVTHDILQDSALGPFWTWVFLPLGQILHGFHSVSCINADVFLTLYHY